MKTDCKQFEKMIPAFLSDELDNSEAGLFLDHLKNCETCREDFSIEFLVHEGMPKLENGESFNLKEELQLAVESRKRTVTRRKVLYVSAVLTELTALILTAVVLYVFVFISLH